MVTGHEELEIDIAVELDEVKVAFGVASLTFEGDLPAALFHVGLLLDDAAAWKVKPQLVVVFHTNAGHVTLGDDVYNRDRHIVSGNPYKALVADMMERGVRVELCGATAKAHGWRNSDTIAGIKINTDAMARLTQLTQQGYVLIPEF
ncbi:DsrE family protein [Mycobacterium sp.]|uniref:DsrE family protein n=1 Tax=Mycobacterium sp. TaxID=1785 RepID=UPI003BB0BCFE